MTPTGERPEVAPRDAAATWWRSWDASPDETPPESLVVAFKEVAQAARLAALEECRFTLDALVLYQGADGAIQFRRWLDTLLAATEGPHAEEKKR